MDVLENVKESKLSEIEQHIEWERAMTPGDEIVLKHHSKIS